MRVWKGKTWTYETGKRTLDGRAQRDLAVLRFLVQPRQQLQQSRDLRSAQER